MKQDTSTVSTESTGFDASLQSTTSKRSSDGDIALFCPPPTVPLKQHVTIGGTDTKKELRSSLRHRGTSSVGGTSDDSSFFPSMSPFSTSMSQQRVSKIFFRDLERNKNANGTSARKSFFHTDLQALFDAHAFDERDEDFSVPRQRSSRTLGGGILVDEETVRVTTTSLTDDDDDDTKLTFGGVEIREYPIIPGDSPAGYKGPPLTIDWKPVTTVRIPHIDKYESAREGHRRVTKELNMNSNQRMEILRNQGFARSEIQKSIKLANIGRRQRRETMATLKHEAAYEKLETIQRKAMNILTLGKRSRAKKEYLKKYVPSYGVAPQQ